MNQTAIITGGSRGLGATVAEYLARLGYDLILTARGAEALQATARRLAAHGTTVRAITGDVTDASHRQRLAAAAAEKTAAGVSRPDGSIVYPAAQGTLL